MAVSCYSTTLCEAVDTRGYSAKYTGTWAAATDIDGSNNLLSVSCASSTFCAAVDSTGHVVTYNGSTWSAATLIDPVTTYLEAVSCASSTFCAAVDSTGHVVTYNGSSWSSPATDIDGTNSVYGVSCLSSTFCVAVDTSGHALTYNGSTWSAAADIDGSNLLTGVSCTSSPSTFCVAVDMSGNALTYNGTSWSAATDIDGTNELTAVSCASSTFCEAVEARGYSVKYTGSWAPATDADTSNWLYGVSCVSSTFCVAVDTSGNDVIYSGSTWSAAADIDGTKILKSVSCPSSTFCVAVDTSGNALTYNGSSWSAATNIDGTNAPNGVSCASSSFCVAVDSYDNAMLYAPATTYDSDTWLYTASSDTWTPESPSTKPSARAGASMAYNAATSQIVLFGGQNGSTYNNETWLYTASSDTWTQESPSGPPSARAGASMAYDAATAQIVMFGGQNGSTYNNETWLYTASNDTWTQESPSGPPSARAGAAMGYNAATAQIVMFGGQNGSTYDYDTWLYNPSANTWTVQSPTTSPSARSFAGSTGTSTEVIVSGGTTSSGDVSDIWTYYGGNWVQQSSSSSPTARDHPAMTYDATSNVVVLLGGQNGSTVDGDTWTGVFSTLGVETAGTLTWTATLGGVDQTVDASSSITVVDTVGVGWNLEVSATPLTSGSNTLPAPKINGSSSSATATTAPATSCAGGTGTCVAPAGTAVTYPVTVPTGTPASLYTSNSGSGIDGVTLSLDWWLTVPGDASAGTYTDTITVTVVSGP
jgi:hypothetical protein